MWPIANIEDVREILRKETEAKQAKLEEEAMAEF